MRYKTTLDHVKGLPAKFPLGKYFFYIAMAVNLGGYFLLNMINVMGQTGFLFNDFYITFMPGVEKVLADPANLYDPINGICVVGEFCNAYRNLPALTLYHYIFYKLGPTGHLDLFFCSLFIVYFNLASCWLVFKVANHEKVRAMSAKNIFSSPYIIAGAYMIVLWHYPEYNSGHTQAITGFFGLLGLYFMLNDKDHLGFMSWSIGTIFKLNLAAWILFLIWKRPFSRLLRNVVFCLIPQIPNIIMFLTWPKLLLDFIPSNIAFSLENAVAFYRVSGTFSRELSYLFNVPITGFTIATAAIIVPAVLFILNKRRLHLVDQVFLVILATIAILPDFWMAHSLYVIVPYVLWLSVRSPTMSVKMKLVCFVPIFFILPWSLLYTAVLGINYSTIPRNTFSFPVISTLFIIPLVLMIVNAIKQKPVEIKIEQDPKIRA